MRRRPAASGTTPFGISDGDFVSVAGRGVHNLPQPTAAEDGSTTRVHGDVRKLMVVVSPERTTYGPTPGPASIPYRSANSGVSVKSRSLAMQT